MTDPRRLLVLTGTLGRSPWLEETLQAVDAHTGAPFLHVLITPADRVAELQKRFPNRLVVADAGKEGGLYGALNNGLRAAERESWGYMTFIADDDHHLPGFREVVARARQLPPEEPHVVRGDVVIIREDGQRLCRMPATHRSGDIAALVAQGISPFNQQGMLLTRAATTLAGEFDAAQKICADALHWFRAFERGSQFHSVRVEAAAFRVRPGQLSGQESLHREEFSRLAARASALHQGALWPAKLRFRWDNLSSYWERFRRVGPRSGHGLLQEA